MKTYKFKEAIKVLSYGGFIKEPSYYFTKHTPLFSKHGALIGFITYDCYFEICDSLGGLLKLGKNFEELDTDRATPFSTITGDFNLVDKMLAVC